VCTGLVMASVAMVVAFAPHHSASYSADHMRWLFQQPSFFAFAAIVIVVIGGAYGVKRRVYARLGRDWSKLENWRDRAVVHLSYGVLGGTFGGLNITLVKTTFTLIIDEFERGTSGGGDVFGGLGAVVSSWLVWLVSMSLLGTFFLELKSTTDGLQFSSAMIVVSTLSVVEEVIATLGALLFFQDFVYFSVQQAVVFALGNTLAVVCVITMASLRLRRPHVANLRNEAADEDDVIITGTAATAECIKDPVQGVDRV